MPSGLRPAGLAERLPSSKRGRDLLLASNGRGQLAGDLVGAQYIVPSLFASRSHSPFRGVIPNGERDLLFVHSLAAPVVKLV
jgi:hypothetical protein